MKVLNLYLTDRKLTLRTLISTHDLDIDKNRLAELIRLEKFIIDWKQELDNLINN